MSSSVWGTAVVAAALACPLAGCASAEAEDGRGVLPAVVTPLFAEPYRPWTRFTPPFGWMNDPNGLVHVAGVWHLFYQYNPYARTFGNIGWGHAVSDDLIAWEFWPVALPPEGDRLIFSGGAVVDRANTSGLCTSPDCIVAVYTRNAPSAGGRNQSQAISVSNDGGRTFTAFEGNPVLDEARADFRDPKVFWHAPTERWIMVLALPLEHQVAIYGSPDLRAWERLSIFGPAGATGGVWECPDLFPLAQDGDPARLRWVMKVDLNPGAAAGGSGGQYFIGEFDGVRFIADLPAAAPPRWLDYGKDFYCATTWSDEADPGTASRRWIGWMSDWQYASDVPTFPWRGGFTVPREVALATVGGEPRLVQRPVPELESLRGEPRAIDASLASDIAAVLAGPAPEAYDLVIDVRPGAAVLFGVRLGRDRDKPAAVIGYDVARGVLFLERRGSGNVAVNGEFPGRHEAPVSLVDGALRLRLHFDRNGVELFANDGAAIITDLLFPVGDTPFADLFAEGEVERMEGTLWPLTPIWRGP